VLGVGFSERRSIAQEQLYESRVSPSRGHKTKLPQVSSACLPDSSTQRTHTCSVSPPKQKNTWTHGQDQCLGVRVRGDRSDRERSAKEAVQGTFDQFLLPEINVIMNEQSVVQANIERL
jgi:hypothetical protein